MSAPAEPSAAAGADGATSSDPRRRAGRTPSRAAERFAVAVLVLSTGAFFAVVDPGPDGGSNPAVLGLWVAAYAVAGLGLLDGALRQRLRFPIPAALLVFIGLATTSVLWSVAPTVTLRRSVGLLGTVLVALFIAQRLRPLEILEAVRRAMLIVALASLALYLVGDPRAIDAVHDTLRGVVATKNTLGRVMGLGLLAVATIAYLDRTRVRRCVRSAVPMGIALALTDSTGGALVAGLVLALMIAAMLWGAAPGRLLLVAAVALTLGALAFLLPAASAEDVAELVGRDLTLTGRTDIWALSLDAAQQRPALGYGYGAFWHEQGADAAARIWALLYWTVPNAHNGLLDVVLELGVLGGALALLVVGSLLVRGVADARAGRQERAVFRISIGLLVVVSNLAESSFLQENAFLTLVLVAALAARAPASEPAPAHRPGAAAA